jgi:O-antigen/teichoic acid export membrane protein
VSASAPAPERLRLGGRTLREHAARGSVVNAVFLIALSSLGLVRGFILAALLTPSDYGVWGLLVVALGTVLFLKQAGIGDKFVQQDEPDQELAFQKAFTLELAFNGIFSVLLAAVVPLAALAYGRSDIIAPGFVLIALLPAAALQAPLWIHYRRMDFVRQRTLQAVEPVVSLVVAVALAVAGAGYWAFVIAILAGAWTTSALAVATSPYPLRLRYDRGTLLSYFTFSWPLLLAGGSALIMVQAAMIATSRHLGLAAAGAVSLAVTVSQFADRVDAIVSDTIYPAICAMRDRTELLYESFVKTNRLSLMWAVPFGVGVTLFADDLVRYVLGSRWDGVVPLLQALGVTAALGHLGFNWGGYFRARGVTRPLAVYGGVACVVFLVTGLPLLFAEGLDGLAAGLALVAAAGVLVRAYFLRGLFPGFRMIGHAGRAIAPTIPAAAAVLLLRAAVGHESAALAAGQLVLYVAITVLATWRFEGPLLREVLGYLRAGVSMSRT